MNYSSFTFTLYPHCSPADPDGPVDGQGQQLAPVCQNVAGWPVTVDDDHHEDDNHNEYSDEMMNIMRTVMSILIFMRAVVMIVIMRVLITTVIQ